MVKTSFGFLSGIKNLVLAIGLLLFSVQTIQSMDIQTGQLISDDEIEHTLVGWLEQIFKVAQIKMQPKVLILADPEVNAGATLGELIIVYTGLILKCQNVNQLLGVLAHEAGHIAGAHSARAADAQKQAMIPAVATMLLSGAAALAAGSSEPLVAGLMGGAQVFERGLLKHSRDQEETADSAALKYLNQLKWPTTGLYEFLNLLDSNYTGHIDPYTSTHPLSKERKEKVRLFQKEKNDSVQSLPDQEKQFQRIKAKIKGFMDKPQNVLREYKASDKEIGPRYGRAIGLYRSGKLSESLETLNNLLKEFPQDPFFLELKGQVLFETGQVTEAAVYLRQALKYCPNAQVIPLLLAQALLEKPDQGDSQDLKEPIHLLKQVLERSPENVFGWRLLARAYGKNNQMDLMALCLAEEAFLMKNFPLAKAQAEKAQKSQDPFVSKRAADILSQITLDQVKG